ncbi:MAG: right-handed parallel beta-helix repeat-containing protein [Candidatus Bathyarchaeota archaeon]|nr:right-handed parallel beta-helix repeat-containing protein [Candidatus Bathyarchaeota archaeon]
MGNASASESVSGLIAQDTTWTAAASPYHLTGPACILEGATLTIEPGVNVDFDDYYLRVNGTLRAVGTASQPITFTTEKEQQNPIQQIQFTASAISYSEQVNSGCILQNVMLNHVSLDIKGSSPKITKCAFIDSYWVAILSRGGSPTISDNTFQQISYQGLSVDQSTIVTNNFFNLTTGFATAIVAHDHACLTNNKIVGYYNGVNVEASVTVTGNVIVGCSNAGAVTGTTGDFTRNYLAQNHIGISVAYGRCNIQNNAVVDNDIGLQIVRVSSGESGTVQNNNIVGSSQYSVSLEANQNVDLPNNWWGTSDAYAINQTIRDFKVDFNLGKVNFVPFLSAVNPNAPTSADVDIANVPTPPPTQTPTNPTAQPSALPPQQQDSSQSSGHQESQPFSLNETVLAVAVVLAVLALSIVAVVFLVRKK